MYSNILNFRTVLTGFTCRFTQVKAVHVNIGAPL